jgi:predicted RNA-binding Zn ribbon-like protein
MAETPGKGTDFEFSGGALCLDFSNTFGNRPQGLGETLHDAGDVLRWAGEAGILGEDRRDDLAREAGLRPGAARGFLRRAVELRERLYRIFSSVAAGEAAVPGDLDEFNRALARAHRHLRVASRDTGFVWSWALPRRGFDWLLWPVVRSAGELLTSEESAFVRECASDRCSWLFVDRSRSRRRRWCDMKVCGNRAKVQRHYRKKKAGQG